MKKRNYSIDILKFACAVLVVFLHTDFKYHEVILPLTRCAVPCFLMISGFLLYSDGEGIGQERLKRNIRHILHITLWATLLFAIVKEGMVMLHGKLFIPSVRQWISFIVLNDNPFGYHLWYLGAYIYVLVVMLFIDKHSLWKPMFCVTPFLLIGDLVFGKYSLLLLNHEFPYVYVRNFLFVGIPYFALGCIIKKHMALLARVSCHVYSGGVILFSMTSIIEKTVLLNLDKSPAREHYLSTTFLAICLFMAIAQYKRPKPNLLSRIGEHDSLYIYIFHPLFLLVLPSIIKRVPNVFGNVYSLTAPLLVLLLTIALIISLRKFKLIK